MINPKAVQQKREAVLAETEITTRKSGLACRRCHYHVRIGMRQCPSCLHTFFWPCPALSHIPAAADAFQSQVIQQIWQNFAVSAECEELETDYSNGLHAEWAAQMAYEPRNPKQGSSRRLCLIIGIWLCVLALLAFAAVPFLFQPTF